MIEQLSDREKLHVTKQDLIKLEADIVMTVQFDLQWAGPIQMMERYLFLMGFAKN